MPLFHFNLRLAQRLVFLRELFILLLQKRHLLRQLLHLARRLGLSVLRDFFVLSLAHALQCFDLALQLLVLLLEQSDLLFAATRGCYCAGSCSLEASQFSRKLCIDGYDLFVLGVQRLVLRDHALLALKHLVQVLELLAQEDGLVANNWVNRVQSSVHLGVHLG